MADNATSGVKGNSDTKTATVVKNDNGTEAGAVNNSNTTTGGTTNNNTTAKAVQSNKNTSVYTSSELDKYFSYTEYDLLMQYFSQMLKIISSIGDTDALSDDSDDMDDSLADLYKLSMQQRLGTIYTDGQSISTTTSQLHTTTMSDVAAKYMASSNLLK